ncbi:gas vesicle protein [Saccharopolyspora subtropica]|uniref:Gas vesicle protein n=1 Tax=Saccharopolyspora thermophila TaxID=89367 RepID=A0A917JWK8_9PSEU|nr:GvpL/GvpF family gas vesicle protein [Saccharopolyspora subtropica]GGI87444.1 gas vesicle protein [Saccharopolyspora subtropica]
MSESVTYVYGVVRNPAHDPQLDVEGIAGAPVRLVRCGDLAALAGSVDAAEFGEQGLRENLEDLAWLERTARAHNRVVAAAAAIVPVAPLGLAAVYFDDDGVRAALTERAEAFTEVLDRISGRAEWGVKIFADLDDPALRSGGGHDSAAAEGPGSAYLRQLRERRESRVNAEHAALELAGDLHAELAELADATRTHPPQNRQLAGYEGRMVLNAAYLVADQVAEEFTAAVRDAAERGTGLRIELTGPWPPYSFAVVREPEREGTP